MSVDINVIHEIHMEISYDQNHCIYQYIENIINSSCFKFDRQNIMTINKFKRFDTGLQIINNNINLSYIDMKSISNDEKILLLFNKCDRTYLNQQIESDRENSSKGFTDENLLIIHDMFNEYEYNVSMGIDTTIKWIMNKYFSVKYILQSQKNKISSTNIINEIIMTIYVLGLMEWFHIMIFNYNFNNLNGNNKIILCEILDIELNLLMDYDIGSLNTFLKNEYCSHSVVYIFEDANLYVFDPDLDESTKVDKDLINVYDRLCFILNKKNKTLDIILKNPIQSLLDDNYCIFHCIEFMLNLANFNRIGDIKQFMKHIKAQNRNKTLIDVHKYILELNKKAIIFVNNSILNK